MYKLSAKVVSHFFTKMGLLARASCEVVSDDLVVAHIAFLSFLKRTHPDAPNVATVAISLVASERTGLSPRSSVGISVSLQCI